MEQDPKQTMPEVRGDRTFIETPGTYLTNLIVCATSGCIVGINLGQGIITKYPANTRVITALVTVALVLFQLGFLIPQFLKLRRWRQDLRDERERILENYNARIDVLLAHDPIKAARMKMQMEEQWPRL